MVSGRYWLAPLTLIWSVLGMQYATAQIAPYLHFPADESGSIPALLSATGAFSDVGDLVIAPGLQAYEVNQPLWSDGATKFRWAGVPAGSAVSFSPTDKWTFPPGSVLVKHFELGTERRRIETRFEIIKSDATAYFLTYRWRSDHSDADLVAAAGLSETLTLADGSEQTWAYPSRIGCTACHNDTANPVLGSNTRQLNRKAGGSDRNQLADWNDLGLFSPAIDPSTIASFDALAPISDGSAPLELRLRSYLDTNCAVCHNPGSAPPGAAFDARFNTPLTASGIPNGRVLFPLGIAGARVIKAQDPTASLALHRLSSNIAVERMPPVGRDVVHDEARDLVLRWLLTLDPIASLDIAGFQSRWNFDASLADETGAHDGSTGAPASYVDGVDGQAITLAGGGEHVDLGEFDLPGSQLTFSLWVWIDGLGSDVPYLAKSAGPDEQETHWSIGQAAGGKLVFRLKTAGVTTEVQSPPGTLLAQQWTYLGATYDGQTMRLYRDGSEVASSTKTGNIDGDPSAAVSIGWQPGAPAAVSFSGRIDDLRIYNRALDPNDLDAARQAALNQNTAPTANIDEPEATLFALAGTTITFEGSASDVEDGDLSASGTWYSSRDGELGSGASVSSSKRSIGEHLIVFTANDSERVAASASRTVTIVPGLARYLKSYGLNGASADPLADSDNDGLRQIQEYAFHLDPTRAQPMPVRAGADGGVRFAISKQAIDLEYVVQSSPDLQSWNDGTRYRPSGDTVLRAGSPAMQQVLQVDLGTTFEVVERSTNSSQRYHRILVRQL